MKFCSKWYVAVFKATFPDHNVSDSPREDFPSLLALILVGFKQILIGLKVWKYVNTAVESAPTKVENDKW